MSGELRALLIIAPIIMTMYVLRRIRNTKIRVADAVFWIVISVVLILLGIFPWLLTSVSHLIGVQSPSNFVFLVFIFILLVKAFSMSLQISMLETKVQTLAQKSALHQLENEDEKNHYQPNGACPVENVQKPDKDAER